MFTYAKGKDESFLVHENGILELAENMTSRNLKAAISDLKLLRASLTLRRYIDQGDVWGLKDLAKEMHNFALSREVYDQIRFIDEAGYEVVRIDRENGNVDIAPESQLQNKSKRFYFLETVNLPTGDIYVSPLDLNIEHGKIEVPYVPVMHLATPLHDNIGRERGMVILNLKGESLLKDMMEVLASAYGETMVINADGYWLHSSNQDDAWGFQLGHARSFAASYPEVWQKIAVAQSGVIKTSGARYVFSSLFPPVVAHKHLNSVHYDGPEVHDLKEETERWIFVSRIPSGMFSTLSIAVLWQALALYILMLGTIIGATAVVMRARAMHAIVENELIQKSALLQMTMESIDQGLSVWDAEGNLEVWNKKCLEVWYYPDGVHKGMSRLDVLRHIAAKGGLGDGDPDLLAANRYVNVSDAGQSSSEELKLLDGRIFQLNRFPMPDGGHASVYTNITLQREFEESLAEARDEAQAATKSKAAFLAAMSHEIRTPMNGVVGMISLLQETQLESDQRTMMNTVQDSAFSLLQIINDILDFSKIEAGKLSLEKIPVNIDTVLEGVTETLLPNVTKKKLRMSLFIDPDIPEYVLTDQVRLRQILFNLAGNATKFTSNRPERQGKVTLRADLTEPVKDGRAKIRLSVIDNGIGMKPEVVDKLFNPFTQADQSTTRKFGGTGLGLSICKTLTELMGGKVSVESIEGEGSSFYATLPFEVAENSEDSIRKFDLSGLNIAYMVKFDDTAEAVERYAIAGGAQVTRLPATDIVANVKKLAESKPLDILVLGIIDDDQERDEVIEALRDLSDLRFVILTPDRTERRGMTLPDMVMMASAPMRKTVFMHGVAMAAGRASPEIDNVAPKLSDGARKAPAIEDARESGELILVAEDNITNQDVIRRQLNVLGYACEVAEDGMIALEMLKGCSYGLLLTDCHMPNMDGYELTGALRNLEMDLDNHLPVVAITASVLQGEADRCLASGMNDYLTKPLEMNKLKTMLAKWLPVDHGNIADTPALESEAETEPVAQPAATDAVVNIKALTDMFGEDMDTVKEILGEYVQPSRDIIGEIDAGYESHDADAVGKAGHKLKSSSRAIGADALADLCAALEQAGKSGNWEEIKKLYPDLDHTFNDVVGYIEEL